MSHSSDAHIAHEAQRTADHMFEDIHSGRSNGLERAIDEINAERRSHNPAEFRQYMAELNKDVHRFLPDTTIVGANDDYGMKSLAISQRTGPRNLSKNDGRDMRIEIAYEAMMADKHRMVPRNVEVMEHK